jgi:hypothetical protein
MFSIMYSRLVGKSISFRRSHIFCTPERQRKEGEVSKEDEKEGVKDEEEWEEGRGEGAPKRRGRL